MKNKKQKRNIKSKNVLERNSTKELIEHLIENSKPKKELDIKNFVFNLLLVALIIWLIVFTIKIVLLFINLLILYIPIITEQYLQLTTPYNFFATILSLYIFYKLVINILVVIIRAAEILIKLFKPIT